MTAADIAQVQQNFIALRSWVCRTISGSWGNMDPAVRKQCDEILLWRRDHGGQAPTNNRHSYEESRLAKLKSKLKRRCSKALTAHPSGRLFNKSDYAALNPKAVLTHWMTWWPS